MKIFEKVKKIKKDIEYYQDYKSKVCQLIITNCCYSKPYSSKKNRNKVSQRIHFTAHEMTGLLTEIQDMGILVHELKKEYNKWN